MTTTTTTTYSSLAPLLADHPEFTPHAEALREPAPMPGGGDPDHVEWRVRIGHGWSTAVVFARHAGLVLRASVTRDEDTGTTITPGAWRVSESYLCS